MDQTGTFASVEDAAREMASSLADAIGKTPKDYAAIRQKLEDLKVALIRQEADIFYSDKPDLPRPTESFIWTLAQDMPDFSMDTLYEKRSTLFSIGAAVFLGWIIGGIISTLLGFVGLGGEILRPLCIFFMIWLGQFLEANPRARKIMLAILGLGGLARFAAAAAGGLVRLTTGFAGWGRLIFWGARPNIFKCVWLFVGAFFVFIFLSKKITGMDLMAFRGTLEEGIAQRMRLCGDIFETLAKSDDKLLKYQLKFEGMADSQLCPKSGCALASAIMSMLDSFDPETRHYLRDKLENAGYRLAAPADEAYPLWNSAEHEPLYDTIGLINDGDHFRILREAYRKGDKLVKGHAQRVTKKAGMMGS